MRRRRRRSFEIWSTAARHIAGACLACRMSERLPTRVKTAEMRQDQEKRDDDAENRNAQQATSHHERLSQKTAEGFSFFFAHVRAPAPSQKHVPGQIEDVLGQSRSTWAPRWKALGRSQCASPSPVYLAFLGPVATFGGRI